ncbi:hypothetical protein GOP47_0006741 [Adiantum capillus-veneris]|uniref:Uncharacterized protein n=1 Tax=Adiantum capillus-veneris TaxID=13818 RepID=A0A9D4V405_ADICA|nr:hypothetical protein GOP47_0006741 [Adiantum capillus-veneris]
MMALAVFSPASQAHGGLSQWPLATHHLPFSFPVLTRFLLLTVLQPAALLPLITCLSHIHSKRSIPSRTYSPANGTPGSPLWPPPSQGGPLLGSYLLAREPPPNLLRTALGGLPYFPRLHPPP